MCWIEGAESDGGFPPLMSGHLGRENLWEIMDPWRVFGVPKIWGSPEKSWVRIDRCFPCVIHCPSLSGFSTAKFSWTFLVFEK